MSGRQATVGFGRFEDPSLGGHASRVEARPLASLAGRLSPRKRAVIRLLAEGNSMKQAAAALGITARTVAFHKYQAMDELGVASSAQLVRFAVESGLLAGVGTGAGVGNAKGVAGV